MDIIVKENEHKELLIDKCNSINFIINNNASLILKFAMFNSCYDLFIKGELKEGANFNGYYADFSSSKNKVKAEILLNGERSNATWDLASLATNDDNKTFDISFIHNMNNSNADMNNYGVALDKSRLVFSGINHIKKDAKKCNTNQSAKIIVFDKNSSGKANPILKIDENDVLASHAAIVGRLNDEHLFYLKSRGLNELEAKALIVAGYLKPITHFFNDDIKGKMNQIIMEKCHV